MTTLTVRPEWHELGQRIRDARRMRNMTQETLAIESGLARVSITNIELGKQNPMARIHQLSAALGMPIQEIVDTSPEILAKLRRRLLTEDEDTLLRAYRRRDLATIHRLIEAWYAEVLP